MQARFSLPSDTLGDIFSSYELTIGLHGGPGKVSIECHRRSNTEDKPEIVVFTVIEASYARAIGSALISAATTSKV